MRKQTCCFTGHRKYRRRNRKRLLANWKISLIACIREEFNIMEPEELWASIMKREILCEVAIQKL